MPKFNKIVLPAYLSLALGLFQNTNAQMNPDLKEFLWNKDFEYLLLHYAEEKVLLFDEGDVKIRQDNRSFIERSGFRVQVFAGTNGENAHQVTDELTRLALDSVYVVQEKGLFKVQIGNFQEKIEAEKMLDRLRYAGIDNSWIVQTTIHVQKTTIDSLPASSRVPTDEKIPGIYYAVQIFVSGNRNHAENFADRFRKLRREPIWIIQSGEFWKVLIGKYIEEEAARYLLEEIREQGYSDAWLTQFNATSF